MRTQDLVGIKLWIASELHKRGLTMDPWQHRRFLIGEYSGKEYTIFLTGSASGFLVQASIALVTGVYIIFTLRPGVSSSWECDVNNEIANTGSLARFLEALADQVATQLPRAIQQEDSVLAPWEKQKATKFQRHPPIA